MDHNSINQKFCQLRNIIIQIGYKMDEGIRRKFIALDCFTVKFFYCFFFVFSICFLKLLFFYNSVSISYDFIVVLAMIQIIITALF